jgi:hypothetical protein
MRPRRQQDDRDVRVQCPQLAEQGDAFLARSRFAAEIHVLDDQVHFLRAHGREGLGGG